MRLATTTFERRNYSKLLRAKEEVIKQGISKPTILDIGPGGLVNFLFKHVPADRDGLSAIEKIKRKAIKPVEALLRKSYFFKLKCSEPLEIYEIFNELSPKKVMVIDCESKVINSVIKMIDKKELPDYFECFKTDITTCNIPYKGDIVIAYNVLQRTTNKVMALESIVNSVQKGGILTATFDYNLPHFKKIGSGLYQKEDIK
jgi:hypothetical protein